LTDEFDGTEASEEATRTVVDEESVMSWALAEVEQKPNGELARDLVHV
jgi:hypothetical protein